MINKIAFLGCGSMGEAILAGLVASGLAPSAAVVTVRRAERAEELAARHGVTAIAGAEEPEANRLAVKGSDVVILGVKPVGIAALCREIAADLHAGTVVISVAAAVSLARLEAALPSDQPVIRAMPNTPLKVRRGVVALSAGTSTTGGQLALGHEVFAGSGVVLDVPERQQDGISAISGSGPAYVFYLAEALAAAARGFGLDEDASRILARETVAGAGLMLSEPGADPSVLRKAVSSPNGTTERAIATFDERGLAGIVAAGAQAAAARAAAITKELDGE
ncbi:pyrroline-5-carboxylate reductase [Paenarthrobacter sp. Z7-10]|uniref:pyrroline-5-carboxylate reductase n=1 Tax=Paenarthrobacter sp. Z7-10 TaxID=2787635 RepID=UPI0022A94D64|nr:pyrroline-5-carboxylate reductase [Paenarthrobacter sp. Z7-10]MCZ2401787.1 pyrroline-5-carboxylate reductase [Paenarthrobacter sp. Z7-10]